MPAKRSSLLGLDQFAKDLARLSNGPLDRIVADALRQAAKPMVSRVRSLAPTKSGSLKRSIRVLSGSKKGKGGFVRIVISERSFPGGRFYAPKQELGTDKLDAKHFMRSGFDQTQSSVADKAASLIAQEIERALKA